MGWDMSDQEDSRGCRRDDMESRMKRTRHRADRRRWLAHCTVLMLAVGAAGFGGHARAVAIATATSPNGAASAPSGAVVLVVGDSLAAE